MYSNYIDKIPISSYNSEIDFDDNVPLCKHEVAFRLQHYYFKPIYPHLSTAIFNGALHVQM